MSQTSLQSNVSKLAQLLLAKKISICTAESCTGGMVAAALTDLSGSSNWFEINIIKLILKVSLLTMEDQYLKSVLFFKLSK